MLTAVVLGGAILRATVRLAGSETAFLNDGYAFYAEIARTFLAGNGLCYDSGAGCAMRMPVYPLFLAAFIKTAGLFPALVIAQSLIGASTICCCLPPLYSSPKALNKSCAISPAALA